MQHNFYNLTPVYALVKAYAEFVIPGVKGELCCSKNEATFFGASASVGALFVLREDIRMNITLKKVISVFLCMVMVFGSAPIAGFMGFELPELNLFVSNAEAATHSGKCGSSAWWEYDSTTKVLTITGTGEISSYSWDNDKQSYNRPWEQYVSNIKQIVIDEGITTIGMEAFAKHKNVQTVQLPDSLEKLFFRAFYDCSSLNSITIPHNVISIGASSFGECSSLNSVILPDSLTSLYGGAFHNCTSLEYVTLSNSLNTLESNTFGGCSKLESIVIPNSVTILKENVFSFCINLKNITLSKNISQISDGVFDNCINLSDIYYDGTYSDFSKISIGVNNKQLAYVTIHCSDSVNIGIFGSCGDEIYWSFHGESGIFTVSGNGYMNAYYPYTERPWDSYRNDVKHIIINEGITDIGWNAFCYFYDLETIVIPASVKQIDEKALYYLNSLTDIYYCGTETQWNEIIIDENNDTFENVRIHYNTPTGKCGDNLTWVLDETTGELTIIGTGAMIDYKESYNGTSTAPWYSKKSQIKSLTIGDAVTSIGNMAFWYCDNLTNVTLGKNIESIGDWSFYKCTKLTNIAINNNLKNIGERAFSYCSALSNITFPNSLTVIENSAFYKCTNLANLIIPDSISEIKNYAFYGCTSLTTITIPKSITSINDYVFYGCASLSAVTIPDNISSIGDSAFGMCDNLTRMTIPDNVKSIGINAFSGCSGLVDIEMPNNITEIKYGVFTGCINLTSITIPDGVTSINEHAFSECKNLKSINIPANVDAIGDCAFYNCISLSDVYYAGTKSQWNLLEIGQFNDDLNSANVYYAQMDVAPIITTVDVYTTVDGSVAQFKEYGVTISSDNENAPLPNNTYSVTNNLGCVSFPIEFTEDDLQGLSQKTFVYNLTIRSANSKKYDFIPETQKVKITITNENGVLTQTTEENKYRFDGYSYYDYAITLTWDDRDNICGVRPDSLNLTLVSNQGDESIPITLSKENRWRTVLSVRKTNNEFKYHRYSIGGLYSDVGYMFDIYPYEDNYEIGVDLTASLPICMVGFHTTQGTSTEKQYVVSGSLAVKPKNPESDYYNFIGWYKDDRCTDGKEWNFETDVVTQNMVLYAKWEPKLIEITLKTEYGILQDGANSKEFTITIPACSSIGIKLSEVIYDSNYNHIGWVDEDGNVITATTKLYEDTILYAVWQKKPYYDSVISIKNNTGSKTINYGETLKLAVNTTNMPDGSKIYWYVDGVKQGEGDVFEVNFDSGTKVVSVKLIGIDGNVLKDFNGNEISDTETITVKAGFFQKLISFFKNLFRISRIVIQSI